MHNKMVKRVDWQFFMLDLELAMYTESMLVENPILIKSFTGIRAEFFWKMVEEIETRFYDYEVKRHSRDNRKRVFGGGRPFKNVLVLRVISVLTYLRLHTPQQVVSVIFGVKQCDISRDLRRLLPLIADVLPCPQVWSYQESNAQMTVLTQALANNQALVDATEQRVSRPNDNIRHKLYYSGKKKAFTLKTQLVSDSNHHIVAISTPIHGSVHDNKLCSELKTLERLPQGCDVGVDKGYQGLENQISLVSVRNEQTGVEEKVPRLAVYMPFKKPKTGKLTPQQKEANRRFCAVRVRIEHCIGWIKNWAILATRFRCDKSIYTNVMQTVCGLVNLQTLRWQNVPYDFSYCA